ncbi:MAG: protease modulator HflC [Betaproteobacteria bacterium]|nr:protease modulator HflC [Betaproteobacteria bacterium]
MKNAGIYIITLILVLVVASMAVFTVSQTEDALVFELGKIVSVKTEPGLYFKTPFIENVRLFDTRIQTLDNNEPQRFITSEKKPLLVDYFVKWQIADVKQYYVSVGGDVKRAEIRLAQTVNDELRAEFAKRSVHEAVSGERESIMANMRLRADQDAKEIGVKVLDVRIRRVELTSEVSDSVYRRMQAERKRVANELRSTGAGEAEKIRADADREREVILADAFRQAQEIKGKGDAKAASIYAEAYKRNPEFYAFYRSLQTYQESLKTKSDVLVLDPSSPFFKYLKNPPGTVGAK